MLSGDRAYLGAALNGYHEATAITPCMGKKRGRRAHTRPTRASLCITAQKTTKRDEDPRIMPLGATAWSWE
jgi:hypothetical protein